MKNLIPIGRGALGDVVRVIRPATYTVKEVAELLGVSTGVVYASIRAGVIPAKRLGGRWVIPKQRFHDWLDQDEGVDVEERAQRVLAHLDRKAGGR